MVFLQEARWTGTHPPPSTVSGLGYRCIDASGEGGHRKLVSTLTKTGIKDAKEVNWDGQWHPRIQHIWTGREIGLHVIKVYGVVGDHHQTDGVEGSRHLDREAASRKVARHQREQAQQIGLGLVSHLCACPEARGRSARVGARQRQRYHLGEQVLDQRDADAVSVCDVFHLVGEQLAQLHRVA